MQLRPGKTLALVAVVAALAIALAALGLLVAAVVCWWLASAAAEREWRESERAWHRSHGDILTVIRESRPGRT